MNKKKVKSLDDLEAGIKQLLSESRCSFSEMEKRFLRSSLKYVRRSKHSQAIPKPDISSGISILSVLVRLYDLLILLKDHL